MFGALGEVAKLFVDNGTDVIVSAISPYEADRNLVRTKFEPRQFNEVFVNTPIEVCEYRDAKGMYKKARAGEIKHFTGVDDPYEVPTNPDLIVSGTDPIYISIDKLFKHYRELK